MSVRIHVARKQIEKDEPAIAVEVGGGNAEFHRKVLILNEEGFEVARVVQDNKRGMNGRPDIKVWIELADGSQYAPD